MKKNYSFWIILICALSVLVANVIFGATVLILFFITLSTASFFSPVMWGFLIALIVINALFLLLLAVYLTYRQIKSNNKR